MPGRSRLLFDSMDINEYSDCPSYPRASALMPEPSPQERLRDAYRALGESSNQIATLGIELGQARRLQQEAETARDANARAVVSQAETIEHLRRQLATQQACTAAEKARADRLHLAQTQQVFAQARFASLVKERDSLLATARRLEEENGVLKSSAAQACEAGRLAQLWQERARASNATKNALREMLRKMERRAERAETANAKPAPIVVKATAVTSPVPIPAGFRELRQGEKIEPSDSIRVNGAWVRRGSPAGQTKSWAVGEAYNCYPDDRPAHHGHHHVTIRAITVAASEGWRQLSPEEVIKPGDEWKCDGTGCPTYRTVNPYHGETVADVNARRSPDLPRIYRRKVSAS